MNLIERLRRRWWSSMTADPQEEIREIRRALRHVAPLILSFLVAGIGVGFGGVAVNSDVAIRLGTALLIAGEGLVLYFAVLYLFVLLCGEPIRRWALRRSPYGGGRHG